MAFLVETGAGLATSTSYASVAEADEYHAGNLYADTWTEAVTAQKEKALRMATRVIDSGVRFNGVKTIAGQALEWPRYNVVDRDSSTGIIYSGLSRGLGGGSYYYPSDTIPKILKDATSQVALDLLRSDRSVDPDTAGIASLSLGQGAIALTFSKSDVPASLSNEAQNLLSRLGSFRFGSSGIVKVRRVA